MTQLPDATFPDGFTGLDLHAPAHVDSFRMAQPPRVEFTPTSPTEAANLLLNPQARQLMPGRLAVAYRARPAALFVKTAEGGRDPIAIRDGGSARLMLKTLPLSGLTKQSIIPERYEDGWLLPLAVKDAPLHPHNHPKDRYLTTNGETDIYQRDTGEVVLRSGPGPHIEVVTHDALVWFLDTYGEDPRARDRVNAYAAALLVVRP